jgi:hypothetical protein
MNDSNYRTLFEEMEDMNIKWLSAIFSWKNILKKVEIWASSAQYNSISINKSTRSAD